MLRCQTVLGRRRPAARFLESKAMNLGIRMSAVGQPLPTRHRMGSLSDVHPCIRQGLRSHAAPDGAASESHVMLSERGVEFMQGKAFYRPESAQARDLAILAAAIYRRRTGRLRVLDVMSGSGVRGSRYLQQSGADEVWCNDFNPTNRPALVYNLCSAAGVPLRNPPSSSSSSQHDTIQAWDAQAEEVHPPGLKRPVWRWSSDTSLPASTSVSNGGNRTESHSSLVSEVAAASSEAAASSFSEVASSSDSSAPLPIENTKEAQAATVRISHLDAHRVAVSSSPAEMLLLPAHLHQPPCSLSRVAMKLSTEGLLSCCALNEDYYDLVDIDSFGSNTSFLGAAIESVKYGGLLYLTSTDGFCSAGHRPERSLAAYGAYLRAMPFSNEQGLRMLIGAAVKEGATRGMVITPVFSLYSYHGPVFRVMLRATRSAEWHQQHYGFIGHCHVHGDTRRVDWRHLSSAVCRCCLPVKPKRTAAATTATEASDDDDEMEEDGPPLWPHASAAPPAVASGHSLAAHRPPPLSLSGPQWTGPLHDRAELEEIRKEASARGWLGHDFEIDSPYAGSSAAAERRSAAPDTPSPASSAASSSQEKVSGVRTKAPGRPVALSRSKKNAPVALGELLAVLIDEADERLPPGYFLLDAMAKQLVTTPSRDKLIAELRSRGFAASRCHLDARAMRTNAPMLQILQACQIGLGIALRLGSPFAPSS